MRFILLFAAAILALNSSSAIVQRYLYLSIPDGAQEKDPVDPGVYVFDIDNNHEFVKFIPMPSFENGLRGFAPSLVNHAAYYTDTSGLIGCLDLETEEIVWERTHEYGWDRACITRDGSTIYAPYGWWYLPANGGFAVIDAKNGDILEKHITGRSPHNSLITQDGQYMLIGGYNMLNMYKADDLTEIWKFTAVGEIGVFPFTVDSASKYAYVCHRRHVGFDILDLEVGLKIQNIDYGDPPAERRTHGIALTPDETEVWISDQAANQLVVYDNTTMPPTFDQEIKLTRGGHGWVTFSIDGRYAWTHTPDIIDRKSRRIVGTLKTKEGVPIGTSKFFEAHFEDGKLIRIADQFGLGMKTVGPPSLVNLP